MAMGKRMPIKATRALLNAALDGSLDECRVPQGPELRLRGAGVRAALAEAGLDQTILDPRRPGPMAPNTTRPRRSWCSCSSTTSRSSKPTSTKACAGREEGEQIKDDLEDAADELDTTPQ
jgi:hypothetical protein